MWSWFIPSQFCCGFVCAGLLKNLNTSSIFYARIVYLFLTLILATVCLMVKLFGEDLYSKLDFLMPSCVNGACFSEHIIHALMLSLGIFHFAVVGFTGISEPMASTCYQKCWVMKFLLYFGILFACIGVTSVLVMLI